MTERSPEGLVLKLTRVGPAAVVRVCGSADIAESEKMQQTLEALAAQHVPLIVLDLTDMDFICSQGLGAIITGHLKSRHHKGEIRLVNPQPPVQELLERTRLTKLFAVFPTVERAVASS